MNINGLRLIFIVTPVYKPEADTYKASHRMESFTLVYNKADYTSI